MNTQTQVTQTNHKGPNTIAHELKKEADKNKAFSDVCTVFAVRERARAQVTVSSLKATMDAKNFTYTKEDYKDVLSRLARIGVGTLHKDSRGHVRALVNIKYTLQSIGLAAVGEKLELSGFTKTKRFSRINAPPKSPNEIREQFAKAVKPEAKDETVLVGKINGRVINIPLTDDQFTKFLADLVKR